MDERPPRRRVLGSLALAAAALPYGLNRVLAGEAPDAAAAGQAAMPVIDTHIHLFDPSRPEGVPWPGKDNTVLYKPALPARYRTVAERFGIVGAIEVECSTWLEDNQWVLDVAERDTIVVGTVGNLEPGQAAFAGHLARFHRNPLFRGIRYGNLWGRDLGAELEKPAFVADLKRLAEAGLVLDTANPRPDLLAAVVRLTDLVPDLRVVIDHLPALQRPDDAANRTAYDRSLAELAQRPQVFVKVSEVLRRVNGRVPVDVEFYRPKLDEMVDTFGADRLLFGSDWPNSDQWADFEQVFSVVYDYFMARGRDVAEKYFWKNSVAAYRWPNRAPAQPRLG